jgi:3-deoxy-D-manno-octulosonic acid (KDO) 8-phosphate synthase
MTKEEATKFIQEYLNVFMTGDLLITIASLEFGTKLSEVSKVLDIPQLPSVLAEKTQPLVDALSAYRAVLQNALKGQLAPVAEEWEEIINE